MKKLISLLLLVTLLLGCAASLSEDEFDISVDTSKVEELGIPTVSSVNALKVTADQFWDAGNYKEAAKAYAEYAKLANWLANLISSTCDPFYGASSKKQQSFFMRASASTLSNRLTDQEKTANEYKEERNRAMGREALCYYNLGDYKTAVPLLTKALDLIDIEQIDLWTECLNAMNSIVGLQ